MPKISVIIPVYNVEKYLKECLDSVVNQTLKDIEIICVDDGSTDNSLQILKEYADKDDRIKIIQKENGGLSSARNEGMKHMTGELCYFLDSDDYIEPDLFQYAVKIFDRYDIDYLCFGSNAFAEENISSKYLEDTQNYLKIKHSGLQPTGYYLTKTTNIHVWNKIFKTDIIKKYDIKFIEGLLYEDIYFVWYYTFVSKQAYFTPHKFHNYRLRENSIMDNTYKTKSFELTVSHLKNWYELYKTIKKNRELFVKNYDYLIELLSMYVQITKEKTDKSEWHKIYKLKKQYLKELRHSYNKIFNVKEKLKHAFNKIFSIKNDTANQRIYITILGIKIRKHFYKKIKHFEFNFINKLSEEQKTPSLYQDFCKTNNKNIELYNAIKTLEDFKFLPNRGNLGDIVIADACYQFFDSNNFNYDVIDMSNKKSAKITKPFNLVYGGGGLFVSYYRKHYQDILKLFKSKHLKKAVICPASFYDCPDVMDILDERFVVFCREEQSYKYAKEHNKKAKFILADDMVFGLNIDFYKNDTTDKKILKEFMDKKDLKTLNELYYNLFPYYESVVETIDMICSDSSSFGCFMRTDDESTGDKNIKSIIDISLIANSFCADKSFCILLAKQFFRALDNFDVIVTDRLHVGICSMLLGKRVIMLDNSYKKLSNVYKKSMADKQNVRLVNSVEELQNILKTISKKYVQKSINLSNISFDDFVQTWGGIRNSFGAEKRYWR